MDKGNLVFIGMPAVGKSTVGIVVAKQLGKKFVDSDLLIQEQEGKLLREIIAEVGEEEFLKIEGQVNCSIDVQNSVISPGGSVIYCQEAMEHLKNIGEVIYLKAEYEDISKRLSNLKGRGVVLKHGQNLKSLYEERTPLYEKYCDHIIDETGCDIEETIDKILEKIRKNA